jgi:hypothetical protein
LEAALIIPFAGGAVSISAGADFASHLQADFGDQGASNGGAEEVDSLIASLPLKNGKGEVATEFFSGVDQSRRCGTGIASFLQDRVSVFARLAQVDVDGVDAVASFHQPTQNHTGVQTA